MPRATACSSSTIRMVADTRGCYTGPIAGAGRRLVVRYGCFRAPRPSGPAGEPQPVLVYGVQVHPVNRRPLHVDLFLVRMTEELTVDVPLVATGESLAVTQHGGTLLHPLESVRVRALPDHLPQVIEYSVASIAD